jgi:hypothetical protein
VFAAQQITFEMDDNDHAGTQQIGVEIFEHAMIIASALDSGIISATRYSSGSSWLSAGITRWYISATAARPWKTYPGTT